MRLSFQKRFSMDGKVVLLTGGAGHLGLEFAHTLLEQGASIILSDIDSQRLDQRRAELSATNRVETIPCDLANKTEVEQLVDTALAIHGRLDSIVHNAAFVGTTKLDGWAVPFAEQSVEAWKQAMAVNVDSAFILAQRAAPALQQTNGNMVLISSMYGALAPQWDLYEGTAMANPAAYGVSKAGCVQLARYLSSTLAPVRVNAISPGGIFRHQDEQFVQRYCARTPLNRMATEEDIGGALAYLVSDASAYVTGQNIMVDGGWSIW